MLEPLWPEAEQHYRCCHRQLNAQDDTSLHPSLVNEGQQEGDAKERGGNGRPAQPLRETSRRSPRYFARENSATGYDAACSETGD